MAIVPYRISGSAADQSLQFRVFQICGIDVTIRQDQGGSGSLRPLTEGYEHGEEDSQGTDRLHNVGLVVWQSAFVLTEWLLRTCPFGQWHDVRIVELGSGTGIAGIAMALAGAEIVLTDLKNVLPLLHLNVDSNCTPGLHRTQVCEYAWGTDVGTLGQQPDVIIGADIVYQQEHFAALIDSIDALSAPHTLTFLAFRLRGRGEAEFEQQLSKRGFSIARVPNQHLHEEYQDGQYLLLRICKLDP